MLDNFRRWTAPAVAAFLLWSTPALAQWGPPVGKSSEGSAPRAVSAADLAGETESLRTLLARFPKIRFFIVNAPGSGHQSANLRVMRRLRELGFDGEIQAIYDDAIAPKLAVLVPGFRAELPTSQCLTTSELGSVEFIAQSSAAPAISSEKLSLGILGAADEASDTFLVRRYNVRNLIQLQPRLWMYRTATREIIFENYDRVDLSKLTGLGPVNADIAITNGESFLNEQLTSFPEKAPWLRDFWKSLPAVDVLPAYSVDFPGQPERMMTFVLGALRSATRARPDLFARPIVVPVFSEFENPARWSDIVTALRSAGFPVRDLSDPAALTSALAPGEIAVVRVGAVPAPVFEAIFDRATLPVLLEGKNLSNIMVDHGLPYLNVIGSTRDVEDELVGPRRPVDATVSLIRGAINALDDRQSPFSAGQQKMLAQYFVEAKNPDGLVRKFFASLRKDPASLDQDLVAQALMQLRDGLNARKLLPPLTCAHVW